MWYLFRIHEFDHSGDIMIKFLRNLFSKKPGAEIRKKRDRKYKEAVQLQRNGKLREYAVLMKEIESLEDEYIRVIDENR